MYNELLILEHYFTRQVAVSVLISLLTLSLKKKKAAFNSAKYTQKQTKDTHIGCIR